MSLYMSTISLLLILCEDGEMLPHNLVVKNYNHSRNP